MGGPAGFHSVLYFAVDLEFAHLSAVAAEGQVAFRSALCFAAAAEIAYWIESQSKVELLREVAVVVAAVAAAQLQEWLVIHKISTMH
jgi:hypothetical protein